MAGDERQVHHVAADAMDTDERRPVSARLERDEVRVRTRGRAIRPAPPVRSSPADGIGKRLDRRRIQQGPDRKRDAVLLLELDEDPEREERVPAEGEKSSRMPIAGTESASAQMPAMNCSISSRGATRSVTEACASAGAGSARRSILPLDVSGHAPTGTKNEGTM